MEGALTTVSKNHHRPARGMKRGWHNRGNEQFKYPPLPGDRHPSSGHPLPDLPPHRRLPARPPQRGPDRALPPGPSRSARPPSPVTVAETGDSADRAAARRDGSKHRIDDGEVDCGRAPVSDAALTDIEASQLSTMSIEDISTHHIQGDIALLAGPGDLGDAVTAIGRHPVAHGLGQAHQQPPARVAHLGQNRAPTLWHPGEIGIDVVSIAPHDPIVRSSAAH